MVTAQIERNSRLALVTGGGGGIGAAICRALAADGHKVVVGDVDELGAQRVAAEVGGTALRLDVTDADGVTAAVGSLATVGVVVHAAGWDEMRKFADTDEAFQQRVVDINLHGPMRVTRAVLPQMAPAGDGRIVFIASDAGRVGSSGEAIYAGAKGGLIAFAKTIAREHARDGITANTVCPGPTDTPLLQGMATAGHERLVTALEKAIPMRRIARPDDIAPAVAFLCSPEAGYITGQTLSVSGGLTMA